MNMTAFVYGFLGGGTAAVLALLVLCTGICLGQNRRVDRLYRKYCGERDTGSGECRGGCEASGVSCGTRAGADSAADEDFKRKVEADMQAFSDTMSYSVDKAYGVD